MTYHYNLPTQHRASQILPVDLESSCALWSIDLSLLCSTASGVHTLKAGRVSMPSTAIRVFTPEKMAVAVPALSGTW